MHFTPNRKILFPQNEDVRLYFETALAQPQLYDFVKSKPKIEKGHGRIETRLYFLYKTAIMETKPKQTYNGKKNDVLINKKSIILFLINKVLFIISHIKLFLPVFI